jgi:membrane-bound lytic murein transglycosylase F
VPEIRIAFDLSLGDSLAWAFPKRPDRSLIERAERYLEFMRETGDLERIMDRYYGHTHHLNYVGTRRFMRDFHRKLPLYRKLFEQAAEQVGMDWRLLAAIGYQESHWDPLAVSPTGVRGIMMLTEDTAAFIDVDDRMDPAQSILGGAAYLAQLKDRMPASVDEPDRTWFALAAYNVGYGHLLDARKIAERNAASPDHWLSVKESLPLLTQRKWYSQTRRGYARGWEPVQYVENIRNYYDILVWMTSEADPEDATEAAAVQTIAQLSRVSDERSTAANSGIPLPGCPPQPVFGG